MNLNIVDMIILAVLILSMISGMYKGFIASGLAAVGFVAAWFGAMNLYPQLAKAIIDNTGLMSVLKYYLDSSTLLGGRQVSETLVTTAINEMSVLDNAVKALNSVPDVIVKAFQTNVTSQLFSTTQNAAGQPVAWLTTLGEYLNHTIIASAINVLAFLIMFAVAYLIVLLVVNLLNNVFHFPLLRHLDWLLGGVFGAARGYVVMALILAVVPMVLSMVDMKVIGDLMDSSLLLRYFPSDLAIRQIVESAFAAVG